MRVSGEDDTFRLHGDQQRHPHRRLHEVLSLIERSHLTANQVALAQKVYERLGAAEAKVHGMSIDDIHFHEVGQIDAIIDIAGVAIALDLLGIERVFCSAYPVGHGSIVSQHGRYPNPPPATAEMMRGAPTVSIDIEAELVTPTGAALLSTLVEDVGARPNTLIRRDRLRSWVCELPFPNVTRVIVGEVESDERSNLEYVVVMETGIDDMSPQGYEVVIERIFAKGALDVWRTPIFMKKNRIGTLLSVSAHQKDADAVANAIMRETTTIGVRARREWKYRLPRSFSEHAAPEATCASSPYASTTGALDGLWNMRTLRPSHDQPDSLLMNS